MVPSRIAPLAAICLLAVLAAAEASAQPVTLYYPEQRGADFSVVVPGNWDLEQADEEGGFFTVTGPSGVQLSFRTVETDDDEMDAAIEQSVEWVFENFDDVELDDPEDVVQNGMEGFNMTGTATDKSNGKTVVIVMGWLALKRTHLAEVLIVVAPKDKSGLNAAEKILKSLRRR
jgi:hypothetical protein